MPVKEITVTRWETSDGREFEDKGEAARHENDIPFETFAGWYTGNQCGTSSGGINTYINTTDQMFRWLLQNIDVLKEMEVFKDDK